MHSYCRREGNKSLKLSPIPNTVFSSKTYGLMHLFLGAYPLNPDVATFQRSVKKTSTAGEDIFINR